MSTVISFPIHLQTLYEVTCWKQRDIPTDIFNLIIIYLSPSLCGYCENYLAYGQEICTTCVSIREQLLTEERSSLEQKISLLETQIKILSQFCGESCRQNMESYDSAINNQINTIEKEIKHLEYRLQNTKGSLDLLKKNYQSTADLKSIDVRQLLFRICPDKVTHFENTINSLENEIRSSKTKIEELQIKLIGPYKPGRCYVHYVRYEFELNMYCNSYCSYTGGSKEKFIRKREVVMQEKQKLLDQFNKNKQSLELIAKFKKQNEKFTEYYLYAQKHHLTWDENSLAQEDLFLQVDKKKESRIKKKHKPHK